MDLTEALRLLTRQPEWDPDWYCAAYPDVVASGLDPGVHFLRYGRTLGRNPSKRFDTRFYLQAHPNAVASDLNPLLHYALHGRQAGLAPRAAVVGSLRHVHVLRTQLLSLGFTEAPLADLTQIAEQGTDRRERAYAAREVALWHMRAGTADGWRCALGWIARARADAPDLDMRAKLSVVELLCHHHLQASDAGLAAYDRAGLAGEVTPDLTLARGNLAPTAQSRVFWINQALAWHGIDPVTLLPDTDLSAYDRLTGAMTTEQIPDGPKVSVLVAAHDAVATLPTALRALQEQTWRNLEIIVVDDASPTPGTAQVAEQAARADPRIRLVRLAENGGAYAARNHGLDLASGVYVTLHDADDWSHPRKIEVQARFMQAHPEVMGCLSQQARMRADLTVPACVQDGIFIHANTSSLMFRRAPVTAQLGYWDHVRFSADNEFIRRMRHVFGGEAVQQLAGAVLSFQRAGPQSVMADPVRGMSDFPYGARREYLDAQNHAHPRRTSQYYDNTPVQRPFPAPEVMLSRPDEDRARHVDRVLAADFRYTTDLLDRALAELRRWRDAGLSCAVFELNAYAATNMQGAFLGHMHAHARAEIIKQQVRVLTYGEYVSCDVFVVWAASLLEHRQRYLPHVTARAILFGPDDMHSGGDGGRIATCVTEALDTVTVADAL